MELGRALYSESGSAWLSEGAILSEELIQRLKSLGVDTVAIRESCEPIKFDITPSALQVQVDSEYLTVLTSVRQIYSQLQLRKKPEAALNRITQQILEWTTRGAFLSNYLLLSSLRHDHLGQHSVTVASISGIIGTLMGLTERERQELVLCGLIHDVGFLLNSNAPAESLSREVMEVEKSHPFEGFTLLQELQFLPPGVLYGVLQHHERSDGSGYPLGTGNEKNHLYGRIVGVADAYDWLSYNNATNEKVSPFVVIRRMKEAMMGQLDPESCTIFLEYLAQSLVGNIVKLSNGNTAQVVYWHHAASQPVVRQEDGQFFDLAKQKALSIVEILGV